MAGTSIFGGFDALTPTTVSFGTNEVLRSDPNNANAIAVRTTDNTDYANFYAKDYAVKHAYYLDNSVFDTAISRNAAGIMEINSGVIGTFRDLIARSAIMNPVAFASLPASPVKGQVAYISDSNSVVFHATAAGGGANNVLVVYDGTNWRVGG